MIEKRLNQEVKSKRKMFAFLVSFAIAGGMLAIAQAYFLATIVDQVFLKNIGLANVWGLLWLLLIIFFARGLLSFINTRYGLHLASFVKKSLREKLMKKFSQTQASDIHQEKTGKHVSVLTDAIDQIDVYFSNYMPQLMQAGVIPLMILVVVFTQNVYSGLIMLVTAPLIPVFMIIIGSKAEAKSKEQMDSLLKFSGHFLDVLQGLPIAKVFGHSMRQRQQILQMSNNFRDTTMAVLKIAFLSALMLEILATISTAMIAVEVGLRLVYGHLTFHTAFFVLLLAPELYMPLKNLGSSFHSGKNSIAAAERIWEVLDKEEQGMVWGTKQLANTVPPEIKVTGVSYAYDQQKIIVDNIHLTVESGKRVALVGRSGSGKTTMLKLILGLLPPKAGEISVDGMSLKDIHEESWLKEVAYVSQEPYLFSGTIADNILLSRKDATHEEMVAAAKLAGVDRFVTELPNGYNTPVGEAGVGLSGGEKQRIAVARAFLKQAQVVILDEPTAGLDLETEQLLTSALEQLCENRTVITVAHRLQTITNADRIALFEAGNIVATGTHEELLKNSELYRSIVYVYRGEEQ